MQILPKITVLALVCVLVAACGGQPAATAGPTEASRARLAEVLAAQPATVKARYPYRHPQQTLEFIGVEPGMTVVEVLPGSLWYTNILLPYLGPEGHLIGADYPVALLENFPWASAEMLAKKRAWVQTWTAEREAARQPDDARVSAFQIGIMPGAFHGKADVVLFLRAQHNLARFPEQPFLRDALRNAWDALKPGGIVGVVQHRAPESASDSFASGSNGYLKQSFVIAQMLAAGFELVATSEINANPADQPGAGDNVWRLPPSLRLPKGSTATREEMQAIGESDRMTLKFRKPLTAT